MVGILEILVTVVLVVDLNTGSIWIGRTQPIPVFFVRSRTSLARAHVLIITREKSVSENSLNTLTRSDDYSQRLILRNKYLQP